MNSFVGFAGCTPKCGQHPRGLQGFQRGKGFPFVGSPSFQLPTFQHSRIWGPQQIVGLSFFGTSPPPISRPQSLPSPLPYFGVFPRFLGSHSLVWGHDLKAEAPLQFGTRLHSAKPQVWDHHRGGVLGTEPRTETPKPPQTAPKMGSQNPDPKCLHLTRKWDPKWPQTAPKMGSQIPQDGTPNSPQNPKNGTLKP